MATKVIFNGPNSYVQGEDWELSATLTDDEGNPVTTGVHVVRLSASKSSSAEVEVQGVHSGSGVWVFPVESTDMASFSVNSNIYFQVWLTGSIPRCYIDGLLYITEGIYPI